MSDIRGYDVNHINKLEADIERLRAHCKGLEAADEVRRERIAELDEFVKTFDWFEDDRWLNAHGTPDEDQWAVIKSKRKVLKEG